MRTVKHRRGLLAAVAAGVASTRFGLVIHARDATPVPLAGVPERIAVEYLAATPPLPLGSPDTTMELVRYTYERGARLELRHAGPALFYVEAGALSLDAAGGRVSILSARQLAPGPGRALEVRQAGTVLPAGGRAVLKAGASAYAEDGDLGLTRNADIRPLVVLAVLMIQQPKGTEAREATAVAVAEATSTP